MRLKCIIPLLLSLLLLPVYSLHGQIVVSPDGPFQSIKKAVLSAGAGDTIKVETGMYPESNIEITSKLTLLGVGNPVVDGQEGGSIFIIRADSVTIQGFTLQNTGQSYVHDYAAILTEVSADFIIKNNRLDNVFFGIYLAETSRGIVSHNHIQSYNSREASSGNGIHMWNAKNPAVYKNSIKGMRDGIYLEFVDDAEIFENTSSQNNRYGLHYMFSDGGNYYKNVFRQNGAGVAVMYSNDIQMKDNRFEHNWGSAAYGLLLKDIKNSRIEGNRFYKNTVGIYSESTSDIHIHKNHIEQNGWAVKMKSNSIRNKFTKNNFIENTFDVGTDSPRNHNVFNGNYWSQYSGYDLDRDGIGDVPYRPVRLFSVIIERRPESLILLRSMLIKLLDSAERMMPVLTPQTLFDEQPEMEQL